MFFKGPTAGRFRKALVLAMITHAGGLAFEDLSVGDRWQSEPRTIEIRDIEQFAQLTGDHDRLHTDEEFASQGPFGKPVAHGMFHGSACADGRLDRSSQLEFLQADFPRRYRQSRHGSRGP